MNSNELENLEVKTISALEPGKIYCLQIDMSTVDWEHISILVKGLNDRGILLVVIGQDMNFVSIPKGYEVIKKEEKS